MEGFKTVRQSRIDGDFEGFDDEVLFKLADGTFWLQAEYKYWYHYAYSPQANILQKNGNLFIQVNDQNEIVRVRQITDVVESEIDGEFTGWDGESTYKLTNGQVWQQVTYKYEYKYAYRPEVQIYSGSGGDIMRADGITAHVRRIN